MSAEEVLRLGEDSALENNQVISHVVGKKVTAKKTFGWIKTLGAIGFITFMIIVFLVLFGTGNIIPSAISERLIEESDVQYADAVRSKELVFQQALRDGKVPEDTARILGQNGVTVGYLNGGEFVESNENTGGLALKIDDKIITAENFIEEVNSNIALYNAFNNATYGRAAYYYDNEAQEVFKEIGTDRDNYTSESDFSEVMSSVMGEGSDISINSVALVQKTQENEQTGETEVYYEYEETGEAVTSTSNDAEGFIDAVREKNPAANATESALNTADAIKVADTISKEQRSSLFFLTFMENVSKMKAGKGNESKINEAMNYLYENSEAEVVDVKTGEIKKVKGTPVESPSLYAILAGSKVKAEEVENYSSDRVLKLIENKVGQKGGTAVIAGTITSTAKKTKGVIGRFISNGIALASQALLKLLSPIVSGSLMDNSYATIKGINAGEFLVEGAVNVGKELAKRSGATAGDEAAVISYNRLNTEILAMDAAVDRKNRSPFDITSKNTFLGSIVYNFALYSMKFSGSNLMGIKSFASLTNSSILALTPMSYAKDGESYLDNFGDCETYATIGAVGSVQCSETATFDTSTLNDTFNDAEFIKFVEENTDLNENGARTVKKDSVLAGFILYNNERKTPLGVVDGGILDSLNKGSNSIPFSKNILEMIKTALNASDTKKRIASGAVFVNSTSNPEWQIYKYAQRYVSLARATATLRQYSNDSTAYHNIKFFEGDENPVVAFLREYYAMNNY